MLEHVTLHVKAKMLGSHLVAPLNPPLGIQQHDTAGRSLYGCQKFIEPGLTFLVLVVTVFEQPANPVSGFAPNAWHARHWMGDGRGYVVVLLAAQPAQYPGHIKAVNGQPDHRTCQQTCCHTISGYRPHTQAAPCKHAGKEHQPAIDHVPEGALTIGLGTGLVEAVAVNR